MCTALQKSEDCSLCAEILFWKATIPLWTPHYVIELQLRPPLRNSKMHSSRQAPEISGGVDEGVEFILTTRTELKLRHATTCPSPATSRVLGNVLKACLRHPKIVSAGRSLVSYVYSGCSPLVPAQPRSTPSASCLNDPV